MAKDDNPIVSPIKQIELEAAKVPGVISLAQGIPAEDTPEVIKQAAVRAIEQGKVARYSLTYGLPELREAISESLRRSEMYYDWDREIIVTCGAIEAIMATLRSLITLKRNEVLITSPAYASYQQVIRVAGGVPVFTELIEDKHWAFNIDDFASKLSSKTAAVLLANPNNPTGTLFTREQLIEIGKLVKSNGSYLILDEVYKDFIFKPHPDPLLGKERGRFFSLAQLPEFRETVIRIFSFSKAYAMTGWRVAYLHSDEKIVSEVLKIHDSLVTCAPVVSQYAALAALEQGSGAIQDFQRLYKRRLKIICSGLDKLSDYFAYQRPDSAYFVFPKILIPAKLNSWDFALELLREAKVATVPGVAFGPSGESHLRLCFGRAESDITLALGRLSKYLNSKA